MISSSNNKAVSRWRKWLWVLLILTGMLAYCTREKKITHIVLSDRVTKIEIPPEIVKSKDCNKYHEWFYSHMTPLTVSSDRCPWAKPPKGEIGEFVVNGEKFWIPRQYLWPDKQIPDGHNDGMILLMMYPDMSPSSARTWEEQRDEILVHLHSTYDWGDCRLRGKCDAAQYEYVHLTNLQRLTEKEKKVYPKNMGYIPEVNLTLYRWNNYYTNAFYLRGDPYHPSYWLQCDGDIRDGNGPLKYPDRFTCQSYINWSKKLYVEYRFGPLSTFLLHDEVRQRIINKLKEFQQEPRGKK